MSVFSTRQKGQAKSVSRCGRMVKTEVPLVVAACMRMFKAYKKQVSKLEKVTIGWSCL